MERSNEELIKTMLMNPMRRSIITRAAGSILAAARIYEISEDKALDPTVTILKAEMERIKPRFDVIAGSVEEYWRNQ